MWDKVVQIPKPLQPLHGINTSVWNILLTYGIALIAATIVTYSSSELLLPFWKLALLFLLFFDIAGGAVANFTDSVVEHYEKEEGSRGKFLVLHLLHVVIFILIFPLDWQFFSFTGLYTIAAALVLERLNNREQTISLAAFLLVIGIMISLQFSLTADILYSFAPLFMIKLLLGFSGQKRK